MTDVVPEEKKSIARFEIAAIVAILGLAAVLRFGWLGVNGFAWDEARISLDALRMARGGEFVLAGQPSSVDIPFFPASVWLFAIPFAISPDPLFATLTVAFVSLLTVVGVWLLARRLGVLAGLSAALYMAASPYAVFYGRSIWQPNLLAPLALAWLLAWWQSRQRAGRGGLIAAGVVGLIGTLTVQVHFAGAALAAATLYAAVRHYRGRKLVAVIVGGGIGLLAAVPYFYYITVVDPRVLDRFGGLLGSAAAVYDGQGFDNLIRLALAWDWGFLGLGDGDTFSRTPIIAALVGAVLVLGAVALVRCLWIRRKRSPTETAALTEMIIVAVLISPLFFIRHSSPVLIHYQLISLPAAAVLFGASTTLVSNRAWLGRIVRGLPLVVGIALAAVWATQIGLTLDQASSERPANSALSSILSESRNAALTPSPPLLFFTHGDDPAQDGEVAVFDALLWERDHRILNGDALLILPPYPATLMATLAPFQMWEEMEADGLARDPVAYPRREGALPFVAARYDGQTLPSGFSPVSPLRFADGSTLIGWRARYVGPRLRISTLWHVEDEAAPGTYQQFQHLRAADALEGDPLLVSDVGLSRNTWQVGDYVIVMADFFDAPADGALFVDVGHYTLPDLARVPITDGDESWTRLGPFSLAPENPS